MKALAVGPDEETSICKRCGGGMREVGKPHPGEITPDIEVYRCEDCECIGWRKVRDGPGNPGETP